MKWTDVEKLFAERFDGAFFITIGLIACLKVLAYGLTVIALSPAMAAATGITRQTTITFLSNGSQIITTNSGPFKELNSNAPFAPVSFTLMLIFPILAMFISTLWIKQVQVRHIIYAFSIAIMFADFLNDALNLASVFLRFLTPMLIISFVWVSIAVIPTFVGAWEFERTLKKQQPV